MEPQAVPHPLLADALQTTRGHKYIFGMHDRYSTLNYVVLLKKKSDAGDALAEGIAFAKSHGIPFLSGHSDNALAVRALWAFWAFWDRCVWIVLFGSSDIHFPGRRCCRSSPCPR